MELDKCNHACPERIYDMCLRFDKNLIHLQLKIKELLFKNLIIVNRVFNLLNEF